MRPSWGYFALLIVLGLGFSPALAKSFTFNRIEQDVFIQPDGTLRVEDVREYNFRLEPGDEPFRRVFLNVTGNVQYEGADVLDGKAGGLTSLETVNGERRFYVTSPAQTETRKIRFKYRLLDKLEVANDAALLDRRFLEDTHRPVGTYVLRLHAPAASPDRFKVFIFTSNSRIGELAFDTAKKLATVNLKPVSEDEAVRARVILSSKVFNVRTVSGDRYEQWMGITRQQTQDFRDASRNIIANGQNAPGGFFAPAPPPPVNGWLLLAPWGLLALALERLMWAYQKFGREPKVQDIGRYYREPAEDIPPGAVPYVLNQQDPGSSGASTAISATILDLARRGHIELVRGRSDGFFGLGARDETRFQIKQSLNRDARAPFEPDVMRWLRDADNGDGTVTPDELKAYMRSRVNILSSWSGQIRPWYENQHGKLLDESGFRGWFVVGPILFIAGFLAFAGFILIGAYENPVLGLTVMGAGILALLAAIFTGASLRRWQPEKLLNARKWLAYRNFLSDFSQLEQAPAEHYKLWDYHFVYAAALGVADKYLRNIGTLMERNPTAFPHATWIGYNTGIGDTTRNLSSLEQTISSLNSLQQITENLSNLERSLSSSSSSGGGFGGSSMGGSSGGGGSSGAE